MKAREDYSVWNEMLETVELVRNFDTCSVDEFFKRMKDISKIAIAGEGSSRIFPAKNLIYQYMRKSHKSKDYCFITEGCTQLLKYDLSDFSVIGLSNSGRTKELLRLFEKLKKDDSRANILGITSNQGTPLSKVSEYTQVLSCGKEEAVAATKSVIEEALFLDILFEKLCGGNKFGLTGLANDFWQLFQSKIDSEIISILAKSSKIYFAGRNNGVAEELALKTNEIVKKKSMFLPGTFAVHGIEEVMDGSESVIIIDPFKEEEDKFYEVLVKGVGLNVFAISSRKTRFPTIIVPRNERYQPYLEMIAGWKILVETGLKCGVDLDKGARARKIGNEMNINP